MKTRKPVQRHKVTRKTKSGKTITYWRGKGGSTSTHSENDHSGSLSNLSDIWLQEATLRSPNLTESEAAKKYGDSYPVVDTTNPNTRRLKKSNPSLYKLAKRLEQSVS